MEMERLMLCLLLMHVACVCHAWKAIHQPRNYYWPEEEMKNKEWDEMDRIKAYENYDYRDTKNKINGKNTMENKGNKEYLDGNVERQAYIDKSIPVKASNGKNNIIKKAPSKRNSGSRHNTCTCTCETKLVKQEDRVKETQPPASIYGGGGPGGCYRQNCRHNADCCEKYNICDHSSKTCRDCWTKEVCTSDEDCCNKYPRCVKENAEHGICVP